MYGYGFRNLSRSILAGGGGGATSYLLDIYGSAKVAYSLHQLSSSATLACRVRRSSDNAEQDIGFVDGDLDTTSLLSFVGGGNGFVVKMYDQSGNANDAIQTAAVDQRQIVSSGSLITYGVNGKPSTLRTTQFSRLFFTTPFAQTSEHFNINVFDHTGTTESIGVSASNNPKSFMVFTDEKVRYGDSTQVIFPTAISTGEHIGVSYRTSSNNIGVYIDGSQLDTERSAGTVVTSPEYSQIWDRANNANQYASTTILWESDLSANINDINTEINNYYGIY